MHIGLAGGTFNPVHNGHLVAASEILDRFKLDSIIFIPSARPPHKKTEKITDPLHRFCMVTIATLNHPKFLVSPVELLREESSYSIKTIKELKEQYSEQTEFYFITGVDAFLEIHTWKDPDLLFMNCHFIVVSRPGYESKNILETLTKTITSRFKNIRFKILEAEQNMMKIEVSGSPFFIFVAEISALNVSSTEIRKRISEGKSCSDLLPDDVFTYIKKNSLYININS